MQVGVSHFELFVTGILHVFPNHRDYIFPVACKSKERLAAYKQLVFLTVRGDGISAVSYRLSTCRVFCCAQA